MAAVPSSVALLSLVVLCLSPPASGDPNRLVTFLIDGLRWDYPFNDTELFEFQAIAREGARARYVTPDFPVKSFPNYYSTMTGLHTESHGMTGNYMYDVTRNTSFLLGLNPESYEPYWWEGAEPLWITATKQGRKVNMYYWPTCEVPIFNTLPNKCEPYVGYPTYHNITDSIDEIVQLFSDRTVDMAFVYFENIDRYGHSHGVESQQRIEATRDVNRFLQYLRDNLRKTGQADSVNVVVMSDHGMATVDYGPPTDIILSNFIDHNDLNNPVFYEGSYVSMWPKEGRLDKVYADLQRVPHSVVYKKEDIPEGWHYKKGKYVPPLLVVSTFPYLLFKVSVARPRRIGTHAWDNALMDMKGAFMAVGPDFRAGFVGDSIHQVDIYQMMCGITGVSPRPHNGSVLRIQGLLNHVSGGVLTSPQITWTTAVTLACFILLGGPY